MSFRRLFAIAAALAALSSVAFAQDVLKQCERLNKKAMEDYDALEFDSARQTLLNAIAKLRDAGQDETPTAARIYINLGVVYIAGFKDKNRGVQQFVNALKIDGTSQLDPERATPELQEAFDQATKQAGGGGAKKPPKKPPVEDNPPEKPPASDVHGLQHNPVDEGKAGMDVQVKAQLGSDVSASRLFLFYRSGGQEDYVSVPMQKSGGEWVGSIPGDAMEGKAVQYYIEARDSRGRPVIGSGSAASPYIISVVEGKGPSQVDVDVEDPLAKQRKRKNGEEEEAPKEGRGFGRLFVNVMGGIGVGFAPAGNAVEVAYRYDAGSMTYQPLTVDSPGGLVYEPLHLAVELGANITKRIAISGVLRLGFTLINNADSAPTTTYNPPLGAGTARAQNDIAGMLRVRYQFGDGKAHPFVHVGLGGGAIRHVLDIGGAETPDHPLADITTAQNFNPQKPMQINEVCPDHSHCIDTLAIGYILAGVGGGIYIDFAQFKNGGFGFIVDADLLFALPVGGQFGLNLDVQVGLGAHFL